MMLGHIKKQFLSKRSVRINNVAYKSGKSGLNNLLNYKVCHNDGFCGKWGTISAPVAVVIRLTVFLSTFQPFRVLSCWQVK